MITTNYTEAARINTLKGTPLSKYRCTHWLCDILKNFLLDPINIKDERLSKLLCLKDGINHDEQESLIQVGLPYSHDMRKTCTTPAILVSAGDTTYPVTTFGAGVGGTKSLINAHGMYKRTVCRAVTAKITVLTESLDGTLLLTDTIEDFLLINSLLFMKEGMVTEFKVQSSSAPQCIEAGSQTNAKDLFQAVISIIIIGTLTWMPDSQGPVYRGVTAVEPQID